MAWVQLFPTNNTLISASVNQIQQNWLFLQQNINTDHSFNTGAPSEGHHRFMHLPTQGADPAVILTGVVYQKANLAGSPRLYYRTTVPVARIEQIPTAMTGMVNLPVGAGWTNVINLAGQPSFGGIFTAFDPTIPDRQCAMTIAFWGGGPAARGIQLGVNSDIIGVRCLNTTIQVNKTNPAFNLNYYILKSEV